MYLLCGQAPQTEFEKKTPVEVKLDYPPTATLFDMNNFSLISKSAVQS